MSNRPNLIKSKSVFVPPTETLLTTANVAAINQSLAGTSLNVNAYTATISSFHDHRVVRSVLTPVAIPTVTKVAYGLFLPSIIEEKNCHYHFQMALKLQADAVGLNVWPFFGRTTLTTVTASLASSVNTLESYKILPHFISKADVAGAGPISMSVDQEIIDQQGVTNNVPMCVGFVLENPTGGTINIACLNTGLQFVRYVNEFDVFNPQFH